MSVNAPYKGGEINRRYGDPRNGIETIVVEINKKLFMDTKTFRKTEGFVKLRRDFTALLEQISRYTQERCQLV